MNAIISKRLQSRMKQSPSWAFAPLCASWLPDKNLICLFFSLLVKHSEVWIYVLERGVCLLSLSLFVSEKH